MSRSSCLERALIITFRTGKIYPLVVKLGTIDASGQADVYSYDEDSEVTDPHLKTHLAHFGIDMTRMEKTCRTLEELQVELNLKWVPLVLLSFTPLHC